MIQTTPAPSTDCILPNALYIANLEGALSSESRRENQISHVLSAVLSSLVDLSTLSEEYGSRQMIVNVEDSEYEDILIHLPKACKFIEDALQQGGRVLVHCVMGVSRSATVIAAYMMQRFKMSSSEAIKKLQEHRPIVHPNYGFVAQLDVFKLCNYAPSVRHPLYMDWRRKRKDDITQFLSCFCDIATVIEDEKETLYLSSDFPSKPKHAEALVLDLEITHLVHITPCTISVNALDLVHRSMSLEFDLQHPEQTCRRLQDAAAFVATAYREGDNLLNGRTPKVLVHCDVEAKACAVVGAYLIMSRQLQAGKATELLCSALGPLFEPTRNLKKQLEAFSRQSDSQTSNSSSSEGVSHDRHGRIPGSIPVGSRRNSHIIAASIKDIMANTPLEGEMNAFTAAVKGLYVT